MTASKRFPVGGQPTSQTVTRCCCYLLIFPAALRGGETASALADHSVSLSIIETTETAQTPTDPALLEHLGGAEKFQQRRPNNTTAIFPR